MQRIVSKENKRIKRLKGLRQKKVRSSENLFLIEGTKSVTEAVSSGLGIDTIVISDSFASGPELTADLKGRELICVPDDLFVKISSQVNPQGILASVSIPEHSVDELATLGLPILLLDEIKDPGNLGTIMRTADAFGFGGVVLTGDCVDIYNPKCVQASMGSVMRVIGIPATPTQIQVFKDAGYRIYGLDLDGEDIGKKRTLQAKSVLCIGSESHGLSGSVREVCDELIRIPMPGKAESLNAAVAAAIAMYMVE